MRRAPVNWWYALGEFVIIVVGVLVALGVDELRNQGADRDLEREYVSRLAQDLEADLRVTARTLAYLEGTQETLEVVRPIIEGGEAIEDPRRFLGTLYRSTRVIPPRFSLPTYGELVATGNLRLIRRPALRIELTDFVATAERRDQLATAIPGGYRDAVRRAVPTELMTQLQADCDVTGRFMTAESTPAVVPCAAAVSESEARLLAERFAANEELAGELRLWRFSLLFMQGLIQPQLTQGRQVQVAFAEYSDNLQGR